MHKINVSAFYKLLLKDLVFEAKPKQDIALQQISSFVTEEKTDSVFILKGYAGTGKTTIISALVKNLWKLKKTGILLAPTGRAAKVISNYSGMGASTIHRKIYLPKTKAGSGIQ
ncbi:MAG TPA: AAA family ATPase, partial [Salinimicrobium sp.]|nr:AAA family ATPase [Salinimicrobium sp.]